MPALAAIGRAVGDLLKTRQETVAVAESSTGGLIAAALLAVPGASAYFVGGGVIYTLKARPQPVRLPGLGQQAGAAAVRFFPDLDERNGRADDRDHDSEPHRGQLRGDQSGWRGWGWADCGGEALRRQPGVLPRNSRGRKALGRGVVSVSKGSSG